MHHNLAYIFVFNIWLMKSYVILMWNKLVSPSRSQYKNIISSGPMTSAFRSVYNLNHVISQSKHASKNAPQWNPVRPTDGYFPKWISCKNLLLSLYSIDAVKQGNQVKIRGFCHLLHNVNNLPGSNLFTKRLQNTRLLAMSIFLP